MPLSTTQCLAKLRGVQAKLEASLASLRTVTAQTSSGAVSWEKAPLPLDAEFQQHGTDLQWIADQVRKMEGQV